MPPSSRGLGHFPFTEVTGIRIPLGVFKKNKFTDIYNFSKFIFFYTWLNNGSVPTRKSGQILTLYKPSLI
jgi:hypothetical protein